MREVIQSRNNTNYKSWSKLKTSKGRKKAQAYLIEGEHLIQEAISAEIPLERIIVSEAYELAPEIEQAHPVTELSRALFEELSMTLSPQGIIGIVSQVPTDQEWIPQGSRYILLDGVQDPGNLGTIIRTADAANYDGVILGSGTVDVYNDKVIRSTQGSLWHLPIINMPLQEAIPKLQDNGVQVVATSLNDQSISYKDLNSQDKLAFVLGNEGAGVSQEIVELSDKTVYIPMPGRSESLNVAIAGGILMFVYLEEG